jgi:hypothetical protein
MRARGINYDTGFLPGAEFNRPEFRIEDVERDMRAIADQLHCTAVRISGARPSRIAEAAEVAARHGLEIYFAPFPVDLTGEEMLPLLADAAARAEEVRAAGAEVVFVAGCEISLFAKGFLPGDDYRSRIQGVLDGAPATYAAFPTLTGKINGFLAEAAATVRAHFGGRVTYASGDWEAVDWTPFDLVAVDAYRDAGNADGFASKVGSQRRHGKPVVITEFGTCPYRGAGERGGIAFLVPEGAVPDEEEQVRYLTELLDVFDAEGLDTALWFTFATFAVGSEFAAGSAERDLASYGVVRLTDDATWTPRSVFYAMADLYQK